jgi:hypothetical protein
MTQKTPDTAQPLPAAFDPRNVRDVGTDRVDETAQMDWDEVDRLVQLQLQDLHRKLSQQWLNCRAEYGRSHGRAFPLYSHVTFDDPTDPQKLAIVAGLDFEYGVTSGTLTVRAEIVREEEGDIIYQDLATDVPNRKPEVLAKVEELGRRLSDQYALVAAALELSPSGVDAVGG